MTPEEIEEIRERDDLTDAQLLDIVTDPVSTGDYHAAREALLGRLEERERYREALERIAMYDDEGANTTLERTGSYGSFDEPGSVKVARRALEREER